MTTPYPVIEERNLRRPQRRLLLGDRRDPGEVPVPPPGAVLVFRIGDRYERRRGEGHLTGSEPNVVRATSVSVVDTRERLLHAEVVISSAEPADDFVARVGFRCQVVRPEDVAAAGLTDVEQLLASHLAADDRLLGLGRQYRVSDVNLVRPRVDAQIRAYCRMKPPDLPGLAATLATVEVLTPKDLREQSRRLRDEYWQQERESLKRAFEDANADRLAGHISGGAEQLAGLGIARGEVRTNEVLEHLLRSHEDQTRRFAELLKVFAENGHFDRVPVDARTMFDEVMRRLAGGGGLSSTAVVGSGSRPQEHPEVEDGPREDGRSREDGGREEDGSTPEDRHPRGDRHPPIDSRTVDETEEGPRHVPDEDELAG